MAPHVCPWWVGYLLSCPMRRFFQDPKTILKPHITSGMTVLDAGCAMGFFTIDMARMVGDEGRVIAVDMQQRMIRSLEKRALKKELIDRIDARVCTNVSLGIDDLKECVDFAFSFYVAHEVPDVSGFFAQIHSALITGGKLLLVEPKGHVSKKNFSETENIAKQTGFNIIEHPETKRSYTVLLLNSGGEAFNPKKES